MSQPLSRIHDGDGVSGGVAWRALEGALAAHGLNLVGTAAIAAYDATVPPEHALSRIAPEARTAVVIGNGGDAFWQAFRRHCGTHPGHAALADPLDAFTRIAIEQAIPAGARGRVLYPFRFPDDPVSFMQLAECAGLGRRSLTGVLVHPIYGPWIALRAALLVSDVLTAPRPADGFDPCPSCVDRACIPACPVGAVTEHGWDIPRCARHRTAPADDCAARCHARFDCVLGRPHRYPADALAYHQMRARPLLAPRA